MGYYMRGDYYRRGDYYQRGDLFGAIGKGLKGVLSVAGSLAGVVPGGAVVKTGLSLAGKAFSFPGGGGGPPTGLRFGIPGDEEMQQQGPPSSRPQGYHLNKHRLAPSHIRPGGAAPGTVWVRNRHMNVANPRALARASRRAHGFLKMSRHFVRYFTPKAHKGKAYIARRKRSR